MSPFGLKYARFVGVVALVILLDQATKMLVIRTIPLYKSITVIPGFFNLAHITNPGGAFGFLAHNGSPWRHWVFLVAAIVALSMILYFYHNTPSTHSSLGLGLSLIFGGAIGNLIDRLRYGEVIDFLDFYVSHYHWPTFNLADSAVTVGVGIFVLHIIFKKMPF